MLRFQLRTAIFRGEYIPATFDRLINRFGRSQRQRLQL